MASHDLKLLHVMGLRRLTDLLLNPFDEFIADCFHHQGRQREQRFVSVKHLF